MESFERATELLEEVNDNQKRLLRLQTDAVSLQREQLQLMQKLLDRPEELSGDGNRFQRRGSAMMDKTRHLFLIIIFLLVLLLFYVSWALLG